VRLLADRFDVFLAGVRVARTLAQQHAEQTVGLLTGVFTDLEKNAWFLRATIA
jgi:starvation-inducible DNA-binding protein